ncbi:MAG: DUF4105 domain-containing protein [Bdellovibrionales bacterium]
MILISVSSAPAFGSDMVEGDPKYLAELIEKAQAEKIGGEPEWRRLLFTRKEYLGDNTSVFDDNNYFLGGKKGKHDPQIELEGSLKRMFEPGEMTARKETAHPQCIFAARYDYLKRRFQLDPKRYPDRHCEKLEKFKKFANYNRVSLVFSNYYADNPGSMFGHTLLRLHRDQVETSNMGLLDDATNFAALVPVMNPFTYPFQGLFGLFRGHFTLLTYAEKIQEYNNYESRDLWEYELNMTPEQVRRLGLVMWEVGFFNIDYYYLDENCSFIMLAMLEAVNPELHLTDPFHLYAIPADTVKMVTRTPGLLRSVEFKPSALTRYLERAKLLESNERRLFRQIIRRYENNLDTTELDRLIIENKCERECQRRLWDAILEFIDYKEKKISISKLEKFKDLRKAGLLRRARLGIPSPALSERPSQSRPDLGHMSSMIEVETGWSELGLNMSDFRWRPALHDLSSSDLGYSNQLQIQIMDTVLRWDQERDKVDLKRFTFIELTSLGRHELGLSPRSFHFELGWNQDRRDNRFFQRTYLETGFGGARFWGPFSTYALLNFTGGYSTDSELYAHIGAGPRLGAFLSLGPKWKWSAQYDWIHNWGRQQVERKTIGSRLNYFITAEQESFLEYRWDDHDSFGGLGYRMFY